MALWAGRFSKEIDETVNAFNSSIAFDARMYKHDVYYFRRPEGYAVFAVHKKFVVPLAV